MQLQVPSHFEKQQSIALSCGLQVYVHACDRLKGECTALESCFFGQTTVGALLKAVICLVDIDVTYEMDLFESLIGPGVSENMIARIYGTYVLFEGHLPLPPSL